MGNFTNDAERILEHLSRALEDDEATQRQWLTEGTTLLALHCRTTGISATEILGYLLTVVYWKKTGKTLQFGHELFVQAFCKSNGVFQAILHELFIPSRFEGNLHLGAPSNCSGSLFQHDSIELALDNISKTGYFCFKEQLPDQIVSQLRVIGHECNGFYRDVFDDCDRGVLFPRVSHSQPRGRTFVISDRDAELRETASVLYNDPVILKIVGQYLGSNLFQLRQLSMWWSFPVHNQYLSTANDSAQNFHFDLDSTKWLKLFVYLTDVVPESGPHTFVRGSHIPGEKPTSLLRKGYQRISDQDIFANYGRDRIQEICGPSGTVFLGDTNCFHKGSPPRTGNRLVLQAEYALNSLHASG